MNRRGAADLVAANVALAVLIIGIVVVARDSSLLAPESKTTVTKEAVAAGAPTSTRTVVVTRKRGEAPTRTVTVKTDPGAPAQPKSLTTTTETGQRTFVERVFGDAGLIVLQLGAILLAAFVAGAVAQRLVLGEYGGLEVGSLKIGEVASASNDAVTEVRAELTQVATKAAADLAALDNALRGDSALVKERLAAAYDRLAFLEGRIRDLE